MLNVTRLFSIRDLVSFFTKCNNIIFSDDEFYFIALTIVKIILYILQVMIQTPLIIDGLRRCSNTLDSQGNFLKSTRPKVY